MKGFKKYLLAVCVLALSGVLLAGCSGQASSSAASSSASAQQSTEELVAELNALGQSQDYKTVTMNMDGNVSIDTAALMGTSSSSSSADASSDASSSSSSAIDVPMTILAKADKASDPAKMYLQMNMMGMDIEMYVTGENAVLVMGGEAIGGTLEEMGMANYGSIDDLMKSQGGDFAKYQDAVKSITKEQVNGETVYHVVVDAQKAGANESLASLSQLGIDMTLDDMNIDYTVGADGKISKVDMTMTGTGFSSVMGMTFTDYDTTVVPDAPEPTASYSDLMNSINTADMAEAA